MSVYVPQNLLPCCAKAVSELDEKARGLLGQMLLRRIINPMACQADSLWEDLLAGCFTGPPNQSILCSKQNCLEDDVQNFHQRKIQGRVEYTGS